MSNTIPIAPFLDNRETTGEKPGQSRTQANAQRLRRTAWLRRQNLGFADALERHQGNRTDTALFMAGTEGATWQREADRHVIKLIGNLRACSSKAAFRHHLNPDALSFMGGLTCKNKLCQICNAERKRKLRSRYFKYFVENEDLRTNCDAFHLTLTVPHKDGGWRGNAMYSMEILAAFNAMRKERTWKEMVHAGELSVEFTRGAHGLHVHIHAIVLAWRGTQNRNRLHAWIMKTWNRLTVDPEAARKEFTAEQTATIRRTLPKGEEFDRLAASLDPRGSTLVGLESLYVLSDENKPGFRYDEGKGKWKRYVNAGKPEDYMRGIMECLKYHFEPMSLKQDGEWDTGLVYFLAPLLYRKRLYSKFGAFYGVKELNITDATAQEEIDQILENEACEVVTHPVTGEIQEREEYHYVMADVAMAGLTKDGRIRVAGGLQPLPGSLREAVIAMAEAAFAEKNRARRELMMQHINT